jgi:hypothetical protein
MCHLLLKIVRTANDIHVIMLLKMILSMRIFVDEDFKCDSSKGFVATIIMNSWVFLKEKLNLILTFFYYSECILKCD